MLTESRGEFRDLLSSFRLRALCYCGHIFRHVEAADFQLIPLVPRLNPLNFYHIKPKGRGGGGYSSNVHGMYM